MYLFVFIYGGFFGSLGFLVGVLSLIPGNCSEYFFFWLCSLGSFFILKVLYYRDELLSTFHFHWYALILVANYHLRTDPWSKAVYC